MAGLPPPPISAMAAPMPSGPMSMMMRQPEYRMPMQSNITVGAGGAYNAPGANPYWGSPTANPNMTAMQLPPPPPPPLAGDKHSRDSPERRRSDSRDRHRRRSDSRDRHRRRRGSRDRH
ncbi:uncharacterized protein TM35_000271150 [Trypanosoma theileri]|uniref:Uncharacterized protein n=1 Tax=Trypanosoma theileri TaxID=67003 RepID=A0A1X0NP96_9TRYP|nr:uncharacterized protein TM35_000271150 [Trypanosoma theileri]ORC86525.1 hypothetical protein TM35_000271150 [Trypanosoma theileri]